MDSQTHDDEESQSLRTTLEQMRREAEEEVARLRSTLAEREFAPDSSITTATEQLAMRQEAAMLQQTLEIKEQALENITVECRRLEDELEDQNIARDNLKQEVERKERALQKAHAESEQLRKELEELQRTGGVHPAQPREPVVIRKRSKIPPALLITAGVVLFVLLSTGMLMLIYTLWKHGDVFLSAEQAPTAMVCVRAPTPQIIKLGTDWLRNQSQNNDRAQALTD